ncbi:MAG: universal stress protein [Paracoccaceae bacterium]
MYDNILLTIDLNHPASWQKALPEAVALARASKGKLHVMTVVPDFGTPFVSGFFPENFKEKAIAKAEHELRQIIETEIPKDVDVQEHLSYGAIHEEVLAAIGKIGADLVVMASHAPDKIREFLVGSHADRVVRRSPVSVLVVRA